ncbi:MAG: hypothetical protein JWP01_3420 [Myxococcales bacterium]|nr:hypothetical protein [Myxococcales bacterium]
MQRARRAVVAGLGIAGLGVIALAWIGSARANDPNDPDVVTTVDAGTHPIAAAVQAGRHLRIDGPRGPIHVWIPAGYHADTAATIVYVHGYWDTVDTAWTTHQLPEQAALSGLNAMLIAPEAPSHQRMPVNYPDLTEVIRIVEDELGVPRGAALTAAIGHSGAFRTLNAWLDEPMLDHLVMIDAMYGDEDLIVEWYRSSNRHRLIMVGEDTVLGTESVSAKLPDQGVTLDRFPPSYELWPPEARRARLVYIRAQFGHMALVTEGIVLPSILRLFPVERLADLPWKEPLGSLPPLIDGGTDAAAD